MGTLGFTQFRCSAGFCLVVNIFFGKELILEEVRVTSPELFSFLLEGADFRSFGFDHSKGRIH